MTVKEIIELEEHNTDKIYLLKEGIFYRAYNESAMRLSSSFKPYQIHSKYIKNVNQTIYYCGFPLIVLEKLKEWAKTNGYGFAEEEKQAVITCKNPVAEDYEKWKEKYKIAAEEHLL